MERKPHLPLNQHSYWLDSAAELNLPTLLEEVTCDVVIVGGGIAGLSVAYKLKKAGLKVVVLEKNTIGSGTTGGTTGKVTTQHGLIYAELLKQFGPKTTKRYADLSQQAFDDIKALVKNENIGCDWHTADNYVYSTQKRQVDTLKQEATVSADMGLPASFETTSSLPFDIQGAVKFTCQAYFNASKYVRGLAKIVNGNGSYVFEHSEAEQMHDGEPCVIRTHSGKVIATHMIIATKVPAAPLIGRLTYALNEYPVTSYIVAGKYDGDLQGMYISPDKSNYSLLPIDTPDEGRLLLVGGQSHVPGIKRPEPNYKKLAEYAQQQFGINTMLYKWRAMDYLAYDSLPLVGKLYPHSKHAYMIGGLKKWGLNLSMVAANLFTDAIANNNSESLEVFTPHRWSAPIAIPKAVVKYFQ